MTDNSKASSLLPEEPVDSKEPAYDQTLFPALYEMHQRGYAVEAISQTGDWEISVTMKRFYHFRDLPEHWMQCGRDLVYRHRPDSDHYDRKYGAFLLYGWACNLPSVAREIRLTTFYQGLMETMLPAIPEMRSWQQDDEDVPEDGWGSSWKQ